MNAMDRYYEELRKNTSTSVTGKYGSALDRYFSEMQFMTMNTDKVDRSFIDSFLADANTFLTTAEKDYGGVGWSTASSLYDSRNSSLQDLNERANTINAWLFQNRKRIDGETYRSLSDALDSYRSNASSVLDSFKGARDYYAQWDTEDAYNSWYEGYKAQQDILNADDFEYYSQIGANIENPTYAQADGSDNFLGWKNPFKKGAEIKNIVTFSRDNIDHIKKVIATANSNADLGAVLGDYRYKFLTDEEASIYNYYLGKGDTKKAEEFLASLDDTLNQRHAGQIVDIVNGNKFLELTFAVGAGLDQFAYGARNLDNLFTGAEADPLSASQYAAQLVREDMDGLWGVAYDLTQTTANMLPSILVGAVTGGLGGALTLGVSAVGNGYAEMRNLGYDEWQSRGYGLLVGASETALQYFLGGISKLGGKVTGNAVSKFISKFDNAIARTAIKLGGNMASEGLEEAIQTVLEPAFKALMTGETFDSPEWEEVWYSALLGVLSAGFLEGVPTIAGEVNVRNQGANLKRSGVENIDKLVGLGKTFADGSTANRLANKVNEDSSAYTVGRLLEEVGSSLAGRNIEDIASNLQAKGMSPQEALKTANWLYKAAEGGIYTRKQQKEYINDDRISDVHRDLFTNEENPVNKRNVEYEALYALAHDVSKAKSNATKENAPSQAEVPTQQVKTASATENISKKEIATESEYKVSEDGKTRLGDTEVTIKEIVSVKNGEVILRLEDGTTVNARDIDYSSSEEALLYENVVELGLNFIVANDFVKGYNRNFPVEQYANDFRTAYRYGELGVPMSELNEEGFLLSLSAKVKDLAYRYGSVDAKQKASEKQSEKEKIASIDTKKAEKIANKRKKKGKLHNSLIPTNELQRTSLRVLEVLAEALDMDIYTFASPENKMGKHIGKNGWYDPSDNSIHIDIYAGDDGKGTMLFTAAHELTHHIREKLPAKFKVFADFLFEQYGEKGVSVSTLIANKIENLEANGRTKGKTDAEIYDLAYEEVVADACESFLADGEAVAKIAELKAKDKTLWQTIRDFLTDLVARIKKAYEGLSPDSEAGSHVAEMLDSAAKLKAMWTELVVEASEVSDLVEVDTDIETRDSVSKDVTEDFSKENKGKVKHSDRDTHIFDKQAKIKANMTENERYEILKKRSINSIPFSTELSSSILEKFSEISSWDDINKLFGKDKRNLIQKITKEFGVFDKEYFNEDIELSFEFSGNNFRESYNKQKHNYIEFAKMFSVFDSIIESAVGVEIHNRADYKPDPTLDNVFVLMSAYQDGEFIVPVKLEVKKFKDKKNSLYVAISLEKIKMTEVWKQGNTETGVTQSSRSVNISIAQIFGKINPSDKNFLKYIPDGFLNDKQKFAKQEALKEETSKKTAERLRGTKELSMPGPDSMKDSVLHEGQVLYSDRYSYENLTSKPDMRVTWVDDSVKHSRTDIVAYALKNAESVGYTNKNGNAVVYVEDIYTDVIVPKRSLVHGLDRRMNTQAPVLIKIGEVLKNSIRINELNPRADEIKTSYVLVGAARNQDGHLYIASFVVNKYSNEVTEIDVLYSANAKKESAALLPKITDRSATPTDSVISIAQLLDFVNKYFPDILPESVLRHYGHDSRPEGKIGESALYSDRNPDSFSNRSLLANALESVAQNDIEREQLKKYQENIAKIEALEAHLAEVNAKIREISVTKGTDRSKLSALYDDRIKTINRINLYDRRLLNLEVSKALKGVLEREKQMAYKRAEQKGREALKEQREKDRERNAKTQRELMNRYQESRKKGIESRKMTEMRYKIKNVVNDLYQYLEKGTKDKHVPISLQKPVAEALAAVNMDTVGAEERIAKKRAEMLKAKTPEAIETLAKEIEHIQEIGGNMDKKLSRLKTAYDSIINSDDPLVANAHDEVISNTIDKVIEVVGDTPLRDMSLYQLEAVYDMYRMVLTSIRNANKTFKAAKGEAISTIANGVIAELDKQKKKSPYATKGMQAMSAFDWNNLKPVYAFERIGSANFTKVFNAVRAGEDVWAMDMSEAQAFREEQYKKHGWKTFDLDKKYDFVDSIGKKFTLRLEQIMSIYAYSKRGEDAINHLKNGGFQFDKLTEIKEKKGKVIEVKYQLNDPTTYKLSDELLVKIVSVLDEVKGAKDFVDEMQEYLSSVMGEKGNEVSLAMYEVKLFKEKNYFPLRVSKDFLERARDQAQGEVKIKNSGFTNAIKPGAKNTVVLSSFMDVWASHVNEMSMYHAFTLPLEDFYRVYNYSTPAVENLDTIGVINALRGAHRDGAVAYIDQLLNDLNGGARSDPRESLGKTMMSSFKKASVMASMSVVIQQPSAIVRAQALVDAKYFVGKPSKGSHKAKWEEVKKYAPVAVIKEMGYFDTGMGKGSVEWLKGEKTLMDKVDEVVSKAPALADEITWVSIWNAVKRETLHTHKDLRPNSEEFLKAVGERFTEVIVKTQVYDSTLARSANMRSKGSLMNMWTAFMAEPTTSINMLQDAIKKGKKKYIARTIGAVFGSVLLNSALVSIVYAMRDDDEDETFLEKYLSRFTTEMIDGVNPVTYIPFVKDIWSILQGFDVERADMTLITKVSDSLQQLVKVISKDTSDMDEDELAEYRKAVTEAILSITDNLASLVGLPVKNVRRDLNGIINGFNTIKEDMGGRETTAGSLGDTILEDVKDSIPVWGWLPNESKSDKFYDAIVKGDTAYIDRLKEGYKDDKEYTSAIRKALRENDPRIQQAANARSEMRFDEYEKIVDSIVAEGHFDRDDIIAAIKSEMNSKKEDTPSAEDEDKEVSYYNTTDIINAFEKGDTELAKRAIDDIVKTKVANGSEEEKAKSSVRSSLTAYWKPKYKEAYKNGDTNEMRRIRNILYASGLYGRQNDVVKTTQSWLKN